MNTHHRTFLTIALLGHALAIAQIPAAASLTTHNVTNTFIESSIVVVQESDVLHAFSAVTKRWYSLPVSASATFAGRDDHIVVVDGLQVHAFSSLRGTFTPLPATLVAPQVVPSAAPTHLSVVVDGSTAWFFSSATSAWSAQPFAATPQVAVDKQVGVASDGNLTVGFSAGYGSLVPLTAAGVTMVGANGYCGRAQSPGQLHCFSGPRNTWHSEPLAATANVVPPSARAAIVATSDNGNFTLWSALTDTVGTIVASPNALLSYGDHAALVIDDPFVYAFGSATGVVDLQLIPGAALNVRSGYWATIQDGNDLRAFSGLRGTWATLVGGAAMTGYANALSAAALFVDASATAVHAYSSVTGQWHTSPALSGPTVYSTYAGGVVVDGGGLLGFAAIDGSFTPLAGETPTRVVAFGSNWTCESATGLHVFNPMLRAWRSHAKGGAIGTMLAHHGAMVAEDGFSAYFYGTDDDRWTQVLVGSSPVLDRADHCASLRVGDTWVAFGGDGACTNESNFPEWWRVLSRGSKTSWFVAAPPGALPLLLLGTAGLDLQLPGIGHLLVDPASAGTFLMAPTLVGTSRIEWTLPDSPALQGLDLFAQAAILDGNGLYLTNLIRSTIF